MAEGDHEELDVPSEPGPSKDPRDGLTFEADALSRQSPKVEFLLTVRESLALCEIPATALKWIEDQIFVWSSLDSLVDCGDLSPRNQNIVRQKLQQAFDEYQTEKERVIGLLSSIGATEHLDSETKLLLVDAILDDKLSAFLEETKLLSGLVKQKISTQFGLGELSSRNFLSNPENCLESDFYERIYSAQSSHGFSEEAVCWILEKYKTLNSLQDLCKCEDLSANEVDLLCKDVGLKESFEALLNFETNRESVQKCLEGLSSKSGRTSTEFNEQFVKAFGRGTIEGFLEQCPELDADEKIWIRKTLGLKELAREETEAATKEKTRRCLDTKEYRECLKCLNKLLDSVAASNEAKEWLNEILPSIQNVNEVIACPFLDKKQLEKVTEFIRKEFMQVESVENDWYQLVPLVLCNSTVQDGNAVEKYIVSKKAIQELCNSSKCSNVFFEDPSSGYIIKFKELDKVKMRLFGLLGRTADVLKYLQDLKVLECESARKFRRQLEQKGSGLYLVGPRDLMSGEIESCCYIFFHSENDEDYDHVHSKSRAVHFLRYLTQLAPKSVCLLSSEDISSLAVEKEHDTQPSRRSKYVIKKHELQQESCTAESIGKLDGCGGPGIRSFYSNLEGVLAMKTTVIPSMVKQKTDHKNLSMSEFLETLFPKIIIDSSIEFNDNFKWSFLKEVNVSAVNDIEERLNKIEGDIKESVEKKIHDETAVAIVCRLMQQFLPLEFDLLNRAAKMCKENEFSQLFLNRERYDCKMDSRNAVYCKCHSGRNFQCIANITDMHVRSGIIFQLTKNFQLFSSFVLREIIFQKQLEAENFTSEDNFSLIERRQHLDSLDFQGLADLAVSLKLVEVNKSWLEVVAGYFWIPTSPRKAFEVEQKLPELANAFNACTVPEERLESVLSSAFEFVRDIAREELSRCDTYRRLVRRKAAETLKGELLKKEKSFLEKMFTSHFYDLLGKQETTDSNSSMRLKNVEVYGRSELSKFRFFYDEDVSEEEKHSFQLFKLAVGKRDLVRLNDANNPIDRKAFKWNPLCTVEMPAKEEVLGVYCLQSEIVLFVINIQPDQSKCFAWNAVKRAEHFTRPFGKPVAACDYDNKTRVICLERKTEEDGSELNLIKFGEDFKSLQNYKTLSLKGLFGIDRLTCFALQYQSSFVWVLEGKRLLKVDIKSKSLAGSVSLSKTTEDEISDMKMLPNGSCLLLYTTSGSVLKIMCDTRNVLDVELNSKLLQDGFFLLADRIVGRSVANELAEVKVTGASHELKMSKTIGRSSRSKTREEDKNVFSWLHYFYWIFTKFPSTDILAHNQEALELVFVKLSNVEMPSEVLKKHVGNKLSSIFESLQKTRKPFDFLRIRNCQLIVNNPLDSFVRFDQLPSMVELSGFIRKLISFVPIQIARCQLNEFYCLDDGAPIAVNDVADAYDLQDKISLGLFESIFNDWKGPVKVVSSMGKQSTGKSFTLNHLTGSSFNIAGTRCTDGCWMTVKSHEDCLYVILDFEGLGSFERTDQDDMLLSLFNSAISNMTIFKTEYRIDRDTDQMFQKFNLASDQLKGSNKMFQGTFAIVIKDVAAHDLDDIRDEFEEKVSAIIQKSSENNFITKLYQSGFEIIPFPAFESVEYYTEMETLAKVMEEETHSVYSSGSEFMSTMKLLLAKLAICDFTPLSRQQIDSRIRQLRALLTFALKFGQVDELPIRDQFALRDLDNVSVEVPTTKYLTLCEEEPALNNMKLEDCTFDFNGKKLCDLVDKFSDLYGQSDKNFTHWRAYLEMYIKAALDHRFERVEKWLFLNVQKFREETDAEYSDAITGLIDTFENEKNKLNRDYKLCEEKCDKCFLKCTEKQGHPAGHSCPTSHFCPGKCEYCQIEGNDNMCRLAFGHEEKHICKDVEHICSEPCTFKDSNGCENVCRKLWGHEDAHACSLTKHMCNDKCSSAGCLGKCQIDCQMTHTVHKCSKEECCHDCCVNTCSNKCSVRDHFHGDPDLSLKYRKEQGYLDDDGTVDIDANYLKGHFCGKEHSCDEDCEFASEGFCNVRFEKEQEGLTFEGARDKFSYNLKFVQKGESKKCIKRLKPFEKAHDGTHSCSKDTDKIHFCKTQCPTCENICDKRTGHGDNGDLLHHTSHGNMRICYFVANQEDIEVGQHKYKVGEPAVAEICHIFCSTLGRGHIHVVPCDSEEVATCVYSATDDLRRHETCKYQPNEEKPKDEIQHCKYWESINFVDPCQQLDVEEFQKCPYFCSASEHEKESNKSYCVLPLWHAPVNNLEDTELSTGTVTRDGHVFGCVHESWKYHFVFALDASYSMDGCPWQDLVAAVNAFIGNRCQLSDDLVSIVIYNGRSTVTAEFIPVSHFRNEMLPYLGGGTSFGNALATVDEVIGRNLCENVQPCLIFMSDGADDGGDREMEQLVSKYKNAHGLTVYTVGFGRDDFAKLGFGIAHFAKLGFGIARFAKLEQLAAIGQGEFVEAVTGIDLKHTFVEIAAKHPPNVGVSSTI